VEQVQHKEQNVKAKEVKADDEDENNSDEEKEEKK
jgi:hypothetical protein|tara:strand:+ start:637 stop:741 length:105 start_codon:yes stop_codon:yes gene_type:complete